MLGKKFIILFIPVLFSCSTFAQSNGYETVSGFVYDQSTGEALIGANVFIKELNTGATTNLSGYFVIPNVPVGSRLITVSYIGYKSLTKNITVRKNKNDILKFELELAAIQTSEIIVTGDSVRIIDKLFEKPVSKIELNSKQINSIPKIIEADLLRSLQTLPGIQPLSDFSSALYIRGGTPDQNLYMIDGTDVYNPEHAFGLFSTFNTNAIKKIELSKGGFGAEYGGRLSSVLNVTNLDGNRNNFEGDVSISLISASTTIQAPIGSIGSLSGSFRRTYIDQTYAKFVKDIPDYYFYDGNFKAFLDLGEEDKLVISFYGGQDKLDFLFEKDNPNSPGFYYDWGNKTASINWRRIITPELFANFWVTASGFSSNFTFDEINLVEKNVISDYTMKGNLEYYYSENLNFKFGFEWKNLHGEIYQKFPGGLVDASKYRKHYIGFITANWKPSAMWDLEAGLRYDAFLSDADYQNLDPRFSVKYRLTETSNLKFSTGIYHQYLNRIPRLFLSSMWTSADTYTKGSSAYHYILGYQKEIAQIYELEIETYYKRYKDVYSFNQTFLTDVTPSGYNDMNEPIFNDTKGLFNRGNGNSYGLEILLRKDYGPVTGWLGYSLARTENKVDGLNDDEYFVPRQDRTSTINLVTNINLSNFVNTTFGKPIVNSGPRWLLSFNFIYSTGQPITLPGSAYIAAGFPDWGIDKRNVGLYPAKLNTARLPAYSRFDISVTYETTLWGLPVAPYLQIFNVGNRKNVWFIDYRNELMENKVVQEVEAVNMIPILPSIGINIKF